MLIYSLLGHVVIIVGARRVVPLRLLSFLYLKTFCFLGLVHRFISPLYQLVMITKGIRAGLGDTHAQCDRFMLTGEPFL